MNGQKDSRGIKRKRNDDGNAEEDVAVKLQSKLHHGVKEVKKACKKVKTFETQKLVKKLKDARKKDDPLLVSSIECQLVHLKQLDHDRMALLSLRNKIKKDKQLSSAPACQATMSAELQLPDEPSSEKDKDAVVVESRFLSSKVLALEVDDVLRKLRRIVFGAVEEDEGDSDEGGVEEDWTGFGEGGDKQSSTKRGAQKAVAHADNIGSDEDDDKLQYSSNFEDEEGDADGWESGSLPGSDSAPRIALADTDTDTGSESDSDAIPLPRKAAKSKANSAKEAAASSKKPIDGTTFLPSLSVGFIRGDSDSDWSDGDAGAAALPERKNRRGQRARKAIWEKKYGRNANHLKKEQKEREEANMANNMANAYASAGRGRGRGRGDSSSRGSGVGRGGGRGGGDSGGPRTFGQPSSDQRAPYKPPAQFTQDRPIHPSWEAKKKLKEKESAGIVPAQGKRMTF